MTTKKNLDIKTPNNNDERTYSLRQIKLEFANATTYPQCPASIILLLSAISNCEIDKPVTAPFIELLSEPPVKNELYLRNNFNNPYSQTYNFYLIDIANWLRDIINWYLSVEEQATLLYWGELQDFLKQNNWLLRVERQTLPTPQEELINQEIGLDQLKFLANSVWTAIASRSQALSQQGKQVQASQPDDNQPSSRPTSSPDKKAHPPTNVKGEKESVANVGSEEEAITQELDFSNQRLILFNYRTQIAIIQSIVVRTMVHQIGLDFDSLDPNFQQALNSLAYSAIENFVLEKSLTNEGREYLKKLATDPILRYEMYFTVWTKIALSPSYQLIQAQSLNQKYQQATTEQERKKIVDQINEAQKIVQNTIINNPPDETSSPEVIEALGDLSKIKISSSVENDFLTKLNIILGQSTTDPIMLANIKASLVVHIIQGVSSEFFNCSNSDQILSSFNILYGLSQLSQQQKNALANLLKDYYLLERAKYTHIFGITAAVDKIIPPATNIVTNKEINNLHKSEKTINDIRKNVGDQTLLTAFFSLPELDLATYQQFNLTEPLKIWVERVRQVRVVLQKSFTHLNPPRQVSQTQQILTPAQLQLQTPIVGGSDLNPINIAVFDPNINNPDEEIINNPFCTTGSLKVPSNFLRSFSTFTDNSGLKKQLGNFAKITQRGWNQIKQGINVADAAMIKALEAWNPVVGKIVGYIPKPVRDGIVVGGIIGLIAPFFTVGGALGGILGGIIGSLLGPGGAVAGAVIGSQLGAGMQRWLANTFGGQTPHIFSNIGRATGQTLSGLGEAASHMGGQAISGNSLGTSTGVGVGGGTGIGSNLGTSTGVGVGGGTGSLGTTTGLGATTPISLTTGSQLIGSVMSSVATSAVITTTGLAIIGTSQVQDFVQLAFLADFNTASTSTSNTGIGGAENLKTSQYFTVTKTAETKAVPPCQDNKCPTTPVEVTYTITIAAKDGASIAVREINDTTTVAYNTKLHPEKRTTTIERNTNDLIKDDPSLQSYFASDITTREAISGPMVIKYTYSYGSEYMDATIRNLVDVSVYVINSGVTDNAQAVSVVYIGDYPKGLGCWPVSGRISQFPYGPFSHSPNGVSTCYSDAFDISAEIGTPIYAPFDGELCGWSKEGTGVREAYGNGLVLKASNGYNFIFTHMSTLPIEVGTCKTVTSGEIIGQVGDTGFSDGSHLHYEVSQTGNFCSGNGKWSSGSLFISAGLIPASDAELIVKRDNITYYNESLANNSFIFAKNCVNQ